MTTASHLAKAMLDIHDEARKNDCVVRAIVDVPGVGGGVVDRLAELDTPVVPYNGGEPPVDKERFVKARAEDDWTLRERFEQGEIDIDPDDDKLAAQLSSIKWGIDARGRIKIESKDDLRTENCRHRIGPTRWLSPSLVARIFADERGQSR